MIKGDRMATKQTKEKPDKLRAPSHAKIYVTNAFVGCSNQDIRIDLCNEKLMSNDGKKWGYVIDSTIILSPMGSKKLLENLKNCIAEYEKTHGEIKIEEQETPISFS